MDPILSLLRHAPGGLLRATLAAGVALGPLTEPAIAQAAVDPNVAPRAAQLEREGERRVATDMLGRYLAVAPDDGRAWLQLGRFYRLDARDWHLAGHTGDPDGQLYLDLAGVAFDQGIRLAVDSAVLLRGMVEMDRAILILEDSGWAAAATRTPESRVQLPPIVSELGANLLGSCPSNGILVTGSEIEAVAAWYALARGRIRGDLVLLRTDLYASDPNYRQRMAETMKVDPALPVRSALAAVASGRPLCLTPGADTAAAAVERAAPIRLVRVLGPAAEPGAEPLSFTEIILASRQGGSVWMRDVLAVYAAAAANNAVLCGSLVLLAGDLPPDTCRR
ncbi:MAG TPA: hypothetical protein VFT04_06055 [Gemmatimonadales bacterium]|nr:hypothetical protein [Gemmatimonadales bacterium]